MRRRRSATRTLPSGGEKERALSIRLSITWPSRLSCPSTKKALFGVGCGLDFQHDPRVAGTAALVRERHDGVEQAVEVDGLGLDAGELRVEAGGVGDVADQAVEAPDVVLDDRR